MPGSSQKFKKLCEKLQAILLSHDRSPEKPRRRAGSIGGNLMDGCKKKEERPNISGAYVISDNESDAELLDSPETGGRSEIKIRTSVAVTNISK